METNYIYLSGTTASLEDGNTKMSWNIPGSYFKNLKNEDTIYVTLMTAEFKGITNPLKIVQSGMANILCDLNLQNYSTSNNQLLLLGATNVIQVNTTVDATEYEIVSSSLIQTPQPVYRVTKFDKISIGVFYQAELLTYTGLENMVDVTNNSFLLKLEYEGKGRELTTLNVKTKF